LIGDYPEYENRLQTHNKKGFIGNSFACRLLTKFQVSVYRLVPSVKHKAVTGGT
jgi:hypothetical protein